jgi:hypothetical protein
MNKTELLNLRVTPEEKERMERLAAKYNLSMSDTMHNIQSVMPVPYMLCNTNIINFCIILPIKRNNK